MLNWVQVVINMKYLQALQEKRVFDSSFAVSLTNSEKTAKNMLLSYKKAGYIKHIRHNLYAAADLVSGNSLADRFEIGSNVHPKAYISHHSALEFHGIANQVYSQITITAPARIHSFEYEGIFYEVHPEKIHSGVIVPPLSPFVSVTNIERTVIDCIYNIDLAGGLEELIESINLIPSLDEALLLSYLGDYNQVFLWQKTGFILEQFKDALQLSDSFFIECQSHIHNRKKTLDASGASRYYPEWKLYAPVNLFDLISDGGDALV